MALFPCVVDGHSLKYRVIGIVSERGAAARFPFAKWSLKEFGVWEARFEMPVISTFLGIIVRVYHDDHDPPHVHVQYGEFEAILEISTGRVLGGRLPPRVKRILVEWLRARRAAVTKAWEIARQHGTPPRVRPLE